METCSRSVRLCCFSDTSNKLLTLVVRTLQPILLMSIVFRSKILNSAFSALNDFHDSLIPSFLISLPYCCVLFFLVHLPTAFLPPLFTAFWSLDFFTQCSLLLLAYTETWHSPKDTTSGRPRVGAAHRSFLLLCLKAERPS